MRAGMTGLGSWVLPLAVALVYIFLYLPLLVMVIFSCNDSSIPFQWHGFTLHWYRELAQSSELLLAVKNSLLIAACAVVLSVSLSVLFVCFGARARIAHCFPLFFAGVALPEIVMAVGLLHFFVFLWLPLGLTALIAGHTLLGLGFVVPIIQARFVMIDYRLTEAARDLGAQPGQIFFKIIVPLLMPAIVASALLVFILSLDDFLISFFCSDGTALTLSLYIFTLIRAGASPLVNALSTVLLVASSVLVLIFLFVNRPQEAR